MSGGSIRALWDGTDPCDVTITGGISGWTVNGSAVTFPFRIESSTTFTTPHSGRYTVSVKFRGLEIAGTPDGVREVELTNGAEFIFSPSPDGGERSGGLAEAVATLARPVDLGGLPIHTYGNSYAIQSAAWFSPGEHYLQKVSERANGGSVTSYGISGRRIVDVLSALINQAAFPGTATTPIAGGKWPGTSARTGLGVLECIFNDAGHYPTMVGTAIPAAITTANTRYLDGLESGYRAALALMSSESRVEQSAGTYSGAWTQNQASGYVSGGTFSFTTAASAYIEMSVTPAQSGPLAGKVHILTYKVDPAAGTMAPVNISVDGGAPTAWTISGWEQYTGPGGGNINLMVECIPVTLPVDGNAHTIRMTHNGSAGNLMYFDCVLVPSATPNPIAVMGYETPPNAGPVWTQPQVNTMLGNLSRVVPVVKDVIAEFPNALYVPSTMTGNGLYSLDGIHPNDRGMEQRANDLLQALRARAAYFDNRNLAAVQGFGTV